MQQLSTEEIRRYARHIILPEVGGRGQQRLKAAAVRLDGLAGPQAAAALYLAAAGIGTLILNDPAPVGAADPAEAPLFGHADAGTARSAAARPVLQALNPALTVLTGEGSADVSIGSAPTGEASPQIVVTANGWEGAVAINAPLPLQPGPAIGAVAGTVGVAAATEAIKLLLGIGIPMGERILHFDGLRGRFSDR